MDQTYCIYKITNQINGKVYIGFTKNFMKRMWGHQNTAQKGAGQAIHAAIRKYGWENFSKEELYYSTDKQHALDMEDEFINLYEAKGTKGYNVTRGGQQGPPKGYVRKPMTEEQLIRLRERARDPEIRHRISVAVSNAQKGKPSRRKGKKCSEESRLKMSQAQKGHHFGKENQKVIAREFMKGNKHAVGHRHTDEWKQQMSERRKEYWAAKRVVCKQ